MDDSTIKGFDPHNQYFFDPDFRDQKSLRSIVERHGQVHFQPFDQEGLRVERLHLAIYPNATFRMQPCRFIRSNILWPLKAKIDPFLVKECSFPIFICKSISFCA